jgi:hypothetical protein
LWFTPVEIFPPDKFIKDTSDWWRSLQPVSRKAEPRHAFYFGERVKPTNSSEWDQLRKAGSNGFFLIIMTISWIPQAIASLPPSSRPRIELLAVFEALLLDVEWVLDAVCDLGDVGPGEAIPCKGKKRKSEKIEGSNVPSIQATPLSKKARKGN